MRPRSKKHFDERYEKVSSLLAKEPEKNKGRWRAFFEDSKSGSSGSGGMAERELHIEIGCGKGSFVCGMAKARPDVLFVAIEVVPAVILMAMEKVFADPVLTEQDNVRFICGDARLLGDYFGENEVDAIYLNFSDPWPRPKQFKRRLTYGSFLEIYRKILKSGGSVNQKTDNLPLFEYSVSQFSQCGYEPSVIESEPSDNVRTEYESKFISEGKPIYRLTALNNKS